MSTDLRTNRHASYNLQYNLVVITKYRNEVINESILNRLEEIITKNLYNWDGKLLEFNGESDHVHILFEIPPQVQPSKLVNSLKTVTSRLIRKEFAKHVEKFYCEGGFWAKRYCLITTGGASLETIKQYIENQENPE